MLSKIISISVIIAALVPGLASAERVYSSEYTITVTATVLEHRTIIVDSNGVITQISSNTNNDITPDVRFLTFTGAKSVMTPSISSQYQHLMSQVGDNHIMVIDRQTPMISGMMPQLLLPISQDAYTVRPVGVGNSPSSPYIIY